ncbi:MAG: hypothetical protein AB7D46_09450, partial [Flavobacteriaceae bacterium]
GCPALPRELNQPIIDTIKEGTLLYIYADNQEYTTSSEVIKNMLPASVTDYNANIKRTTKI